MRLCLPMQLLREATLGLDNSKAGLWLRSAPKSALRDTREAGNATPFFRDSTYCNDTPVKVHVDKSGGK